MGILLVFLKGLSVILTAVELFETQLSESFRVCALRTEA